MSAPSVQPATAANRRSAPRRQPTVGTVCRLQSSTALTGRLGLVWNLSASGLSMFLDEAPATGALLPAVLATLDETQALPVTLRVVHVKPIRTGDFFLGAEFERPLEPAEMRPFLAEPDPPA